MHTTREEYVDFIADKGNLSEAELQRVTKEFLANKFKKEAFEPKAPEEDKGWFGFGSGKAVDMSGSAKVIARPPTAANPTPPPAPTSDKKKYDKATNPNYISDAKADFKALNKREATAEEIVKFIQGK